MTSYLFGGVGRFGEDGLPVRPNKHDEREVEEDQVDNWNENKHSDSDENNVILSNKKKL